jgi:acetyl-CoA acyltransferase
MSREVVIVEALRTPVARFRGALRDVRADHLASAVLTGLIRGTGVDPTAIDDVLLGCVTQIGEQCGNIARTALLSANWPVSIPGMTVDRKCGSAEAAVHLAFAQIASGVSDIVVAGGAENMTRVPMGSNRDLHGKPFGWKLLESFEQISQGEAAERVAEKWQLSRAALDEFALLSHRRAAHADELGYFDREIVPVALRDYSEARQESADVVFSRDETIRRDTTLDKLAALKTSFRTDGRITAGNASQISDGAAAVLLMSADVAKALGLRVLAKIRAVTTVGSDPTLMLTGPLSATQLVLERAHLSLSDIDLFEVNEAFASVPLMWMRETGVQHEKLNVNGGAIALGHPLGASGARIMTTLLHELIRRDATFGMQTICCAGGLATATVIERTE